MSETAKQLRELARRQVSGEPVINDDLLRKAAQQLELFTRRWIPISEALPEPYVRVLVFDPTIPKFLATDEDGGMRSHNFVVIGYYQPDGLFNDWFVPDGSRPTHWMPLPADPIGVAVLEDARGQAIVNQADGK